MSIRSKILAGAATLALVSGAALAGSASAATPSCGNSNDCLNIFSHKFGTYHHPNFVLDVFQAGAAVGKPIILYRTSNSDPAEDFTVSDQGTVSDFYAAGLVSSTVALHYGCTPGTTIAGPGGPIACSATSVDETAFEIEYSPYGVGSGLCVGLASTAAQGGRVTLQPCGDSSKTVWVWDTYDQDLFQTFVNGFTFPAINGSDTNFSHPYVLDYPHNADPNDKPRAQLQVNRLTGFSNGSGPIVGAVIDTQLWGGRFGVLP